MKLANIKSDPAKAEGGTWVDAGLFEPRLSGLTLKVRAFGNKDDERIRAAEVEKLPLHVRLTGQGADEAEQDRVMTDRLVGAILVDWKGMGETPETDVPYSSEVARQYLADPAYGVFRAVVIRIAGMLRDGYAEEIEADAGN